MGKKLRGCMLLIIGVAVMSVVGVAVFLYAMAQTVNPRIGAETDLAKSTLLEAPPPPLREPVTLKVITFNVQNLWLVGRDRPNRMRAIGEKLAELDPDIVGFQEVFVPEERQLLIDALAPTRLTHIEYFPSGTVGSGLMLASAFPIAESFFHRFSVSNKWYHLWEGDFWAGKGIAVSRVKTPAGIIDVFNTHAQADYGMQRNVDVRAIQMQEAAQFMEQAATGTAPALALGDWNCREGEPEYDRLIGDASLIRLMDYKPSIDNVFAIEDADYRFELVGFEVLHDHKGLRLSDHDGYMATVRITPAGPALVPEVEDV